MAIFLIFAQDTVNDPPVISYINAPDLATAQTQLQNALAKGLGINQGLKGTVQYAIVQADAAGQVVPT